MQRARWLTGGSPMRSARITTNPGMCSRLRRKRLQSSVPILRWQRHSLDNVAPVERALRHGDRLKDLVPNAGHLVHMATHIDVLCGEYQNVLSRNMAAAEVDD